eukprot:TRINITY_DN12559_c0_g1_i1.p1 TRINITY_DN12559_c0_g1~~TRINITY_DN12559_c0_g1_i1.p1  ORF type:complete len:329 (-),score=95.42 TRINITY_DN12559_c0_g1_i1:353-1339(-)
MDKKSVKVESEENRAPKQGINRELDVNKEPNQAEIKDEEIPEQTSVEQSTGNEEEEKGSNVSTRQPFTSLSQVEQDLALARALQDQERAYMMLRMGGDDSSGEFDSSGSGSYDYDDNYDDEEDEDGAEEGTGDEEDEDNAEAGEENEDEDGERASTRSGSRNREEIDGSQFPDDESYARALQEAEDRETTARMMALAVEEEYDSDSDDDSQEDSWQDVDPDNMSYEELVALGEAVGVENKGLSSDMIASLPSSSFVADPSASSSCDEQCVICRLEYEAGDDIVGLPCKHQYHMDCIRQWLRINKVCPVCSVEVTGGRPQNSEPPAPST